MGGRSKRANRAFTLVEFMVVVVMLVVLVILVVPHSIRAKQKAKRISCIGRLKQSSLAFRQWSIDRTNHYPMQVSVEFGGTRELIPSGQTFRHFEVMSNELNTPLLLACPADKERIPALSFRPGIANSNVSYFVGLGPQSLLSGDRTIFNGVCPVSGAVALMTNNFAGWSEDIHQGGINVALADGSVQGLSSNRLWQALADTGLATNWLQLP